MRLRSHWCAASSWSSPSIVHQWRSYVCSLPHAIIRSHSLFGRRVLHDAVLDPYTIDANDGPYRPSEDLQTDGESSLDPPPQVDTAGWLPRCYADLASCLAIDCRSWRRFALIFGYDIFSSVSSSIIIWDTIKRAVSLSCAGMAYQGACTVLVWDKHFSYACM
jgi:hypothetical protein